MAEAPRADELPPWRVIRPSDRRLPRVDLRELWGYRELTLMLAVRDLQLRYRQTLFGVAWAVLQPLAAMAIFSLVFGSLAGVPSDGVPYPVFVLAALTVWSFLSSAVSTAAETLVEHRDLITKVWFPRMLAPTAAVLATCVDLLIAVGLLVPIMAAYRIEPPIQVLTLPLWLIGAVFLAMAVSLWLSAANVLYRDVRYALGFLLQLWLFISPVVFSSSLVQGAWRYVFALNPAAGIIDGVRWALFGAPAPGPELAVSVVALAVLLVAGALYFRSVERYFADAI
jgi:lipopolysaccharide transport system permease protein